MIIDLNVRGKSIKLLKENIGVDLHNLGLGKIFLDVTPKMEQQKKKKINWTSSKLKTCASKGTIKEVKGQLTKW